MAARFKDLVMDAVDHQALADWWCAALGYERREPPAGHSATPREWPVPIYDPAGCGPLIWVNPVAEPKTVKNRIHLDVFGSTDELLALGATVMRLRDDSIAWDVLADPEGNEFCVFTPKPSSVRHWPTASDPGR
ncbi:VOC family protein [Streptomyces boncukensis]|uniref:VOC family protein n=1 Tax=Streptomyces boncukensis TaxID=2711219 RepID=A0A6G4WYL9_9ACTN|nr:VOC family protein [Streptomyces boncukensis]NGO69614.1 VOC family protein [Streptomyces boncukensis]